MAPETQLKQTMKKLFIQFLMMQNAFHNYIKNVEEQNGITWETYFDKKYTEPNKVLQFSFCWDDSPERAEYWVYLDLLWQTRCLILFPPLTILGVSLN